MFPVGDPGGQRLVGFLGRALTESEDTPRYLNSPATALYRKGEVLYGLGAHPGRQALAGGARPVLVEGPLDAIAVTSAGAGLYAGIAPCGTALTAEQVTVLDTHAGPLADRGVIAAFDHDPGGRQAALRAYELLAATGAWPTTAALPEGQDPAAPWPSTADRWRCAPPWTRHHTAGRCCASASVSEPAQTRWCSTFSTLSFGFGECAGAGQRLR